MIRHILILAAVSAAAAPLELARNGRSRYSIHLNSNAIPSERRAASELQHFLAEITGVRLPLSSADQPPPFSILLRANSRLGPEAYRIRTEASRLIIEGGRPRGVLYGVYGLLDKLGCRWFTSEVSRIPKRSVLTVDAKDETHSPAFEYREPFYTEAFDKDWAARNRTNGQSARLDAETGGKLQYYPFVHSFYQMIPPEKHFKDHPEYFSEIDGKRRWERGQLCLTNPDVLRLGVDAVRGWIKEHPEATLFSVSQNDWTGWCECERCRRVEQEEGGAHSGPLIRYVNAVAAEIAKTHPDKLIDTLAYWYTEQPPSKTIPAKNVRIRLCPIGACEAHPYEKCPYNRLFVNLLDAWAKRTDRLYVWHYNTNFSHYLMPFPNLDEIRADVPMYRRKGVMGLFLQGAYAPGGGGEMAELKSYLMARLLWNPEADMTRDRDEFLAAVYGPAAPVLAEYLEQLHAQVRSGRHFWIFSNTDVPYVTEEFLVKARTLWGRALAATTDPVIQRRIRKAKLSTDYVELTRAKRFDLSDGNYAPRDLPALRDRFESFIDTARGFGIEQLHEGVNLDTDRTIFQQAMRPFPAIVLENAALKAVVVPDIDARVVRLTDKSTGGELARVPDPGERLYPDAGGIVAHVAADHHARPCRAPWRTVEASALRIRLATECPGLGVSRVIELDGARLRTVLTAEGAAEEPTPVALLARADWSPGPANEPALAVRYTSQSGANVDRDLFAAGGVTSGNENLDGGACPNGQWTATDRHARPGLLVSFLPAEVSRCALGWTVRIENRITLNLWTRETKLARGERLTLEATYAAAP